MRLSEKKNVDKSSMDTKKSRRTRFGTCERCARDSRGDDENPQKRRLSRDADGQHLAVSAAAEVVDT